LKFPARIKTSALAAIVSAVALFALFAGPYGRAQDEPQRRPRRVSAPTPAPASKPQTPRGASGAGEEVDDDDVVRIETQLISVPAVVTDRAGRPLTGLRAADFQIFEDGRQQKLANFATMEAPFEVALLLDTSGSTRADVGLIRRAALDFIAALRPGDRVAIVAFNTKQEGSEKLAEVEVKAKLTDDRDELEEAVESIGASNGTPFYDSLEKVAQEVFRDKPKEDMRGRRALVALTDGVDSTSAASYEETRELLKNAGVVSYFIQVNTEDFVEERLMQDCQGCRTVRTAARSAFRARSSSAIAASSHRAPTPPTFRTSARWDSSSACT
jgi:Ca-activated chloride channel homolog